jgi:hypothetical protein
MWVSTHHSQPCITAGGADPSGHNNLALQLLLLGCSGGSTHGDDDEDDGAAHCGRSLVQAEAHLEAAIEAEWAMHKRPYLTAQRSLRWLQQVQRASNSNHEGGGGRSRSTSSHDATDPARPTNHTSQFSSSLLPSLPSSPLLPRVPMRQRCTRACQKQIVSAVDRGIYRLSCLTPILPLDWFNETTANHQEGS